MDIHFTLPVYALAVWQSVTFDPVRQSADTL